jgi:hypothetical protein
MLNHTKKSLNPAKTTNKDRKADNLPTEPTRNVHSLPDLLASPK